MVTTTTRLARLNALLATASPTTRDAYLRHIARVQVGHYPSWQELVPLTTLDCPQSSSGPEVTDLEVDGLGRGGRWSAHVLYEGGRFLVVAHHPRGSFELISFPDRDFHIWRTQRTLVVQTWTELYTYDSRRWRRWRDATFVPESVTHFGAPIVAQAVDGRISTLTVEEAMARFDLIEDDEGTRVLEVSFNGMTLGDTVYDPFAHTTQQVIGASKLCLQYVNNRLCIRAD